MALTRRAGPRGPPPPSQIGLDHPGVPLHVAGPAFGDLLPVVEDGDAIRDLHHHPHVVLDEEQGALALLHQPAQQCHQAAGLALGHARGGLVEQQQRRIGGERARQLEASLVAVGQVARELVGLVPQAGHFEELGAVLPLPPLLLPPALVTGDHVPEGQGDPAVHAHQHVLDGGHPREQADVLEGAADAQRGDLVGAPTQDRGAPERHDTFLRHVDPGEHVEERGLARSVGTDDRGDVTFLEREVHRVQRGQPAEALAHGPGLEQRHQGFSVNSRCRRFAGRMPWGRKIIMSTRMRPKTIRSYLAGSSWVGRLTRSEPKMTVPALRSSLSQSERPFSTCRFRMVTTAAPRIAPGIEPMPPRMIMASTPMDSMNVKDSGLMKICLAEKSTPTVPAKEAPQAKASSFMRTRGTPMACAAVWSSRIASHARPMCESSRRRFASTVAPTMRSTSAYR